MELDFEDLISQSIITNDDDSDNAKSVSVKTTQSKEYDLVYNKNDSSFHIKVKKDGFICDECGEIYEEEHELTNHKRLQKCRRKYKTKAELKEIPLEYNVNRFLQIDLSTYHEIIDDNEDNSLESDDFNDENSEAHKPNEKFTCTECGRVCANAVGLRMHTRVHKPKRGRKTWFPSLNLNLN